MYPVREMMIKFGIENCEQWEKEKMRSCKLQDIIKAIKKVKKSVDDLEINRYLIWNEKFGVGMEED